jgi:hypothetical protein
MKGNQSMAGHGTTFYQIFRTEVIRCTAALWPVLAIALMAAALAAISSCSTGDTKRANVLVIPLRMGLAKDNGASPWYGELAIGGGPAADAGSARQLFKFIMDTGTSSTWVTSRECDTVPCRHHRRYDPQLSETHVWIDQQVRDSELGPWGKFQFKVGQDTWHFWAVDPQRGEQDRTLYSVPGMKFLEAVTLIDGQNPDGTANTNWDDLVQDGSLAIPSENAASTSTQLLDLLLAGKWVDRKLVSYWTNRELNRGEVVLGGFNETRYDPASLRTYPVSRDITSADNASSLWSVRLDEIRVGDTQVELPSGGAALAVDTGSSRFKGDPAIVDDIVNLLTDNGARPQRVKDPAALDSYPDLTIVLVDQDGGRNEYTLLAHEYFQEFPDDWRLAFHALQPTESSSTAGLLLAGSVFLDHYYTVFDYTTDPVRIGIAERVDP